MTPKLGLEGTGGKGTGFRYAQNFQEHKQRTFLGTGNFSLLLAGKVKTDWHPDTVIRCCRNLSASGLLWTFAALRGLTRHISDFLIFFGDPRALEIF